MRNCIYFASIATIDATSQSMRNTSQCSQNHKLFKIIAGRGNSSEK